jgi:lipopolysaccharide export system protein LptA
MTLRAILTGGLFAVCVFTLAGAADPEAPEVRSVPASEAAGRIGLSVPRNAPMSIAARELEAVRDGKGRERVVFRGDVRVEQGDLQVTCDWLEAIYPHGAGGQPDRITARGDVHIQQTDTEVLCSEVVFTQGACDTLCTSDSGTAVLRRGKSLVEGEEIHFDLCTGMLRVRNGRVKVRRGSEDTSAPTVEKP